MTDQMTAWFTQHQTLLSWTGSLSAGMFVFSLLMLPWLLCRIPSDYFNRDRSCQTWLVLLHPHNLLRNMLGLPILLAGILMLVLPGQGLLTIFLGLAIMQFPGKHKLERWVVSRRGVLTAINWFRRRGSVTELSL